MLSTSLFEDDNLKSENRLEGLHYLTPSFPIKLKQSRVCTRHKDRPASMGGWNTTETLRNKPVLLWSRDFK